MKKMWRNSFLLCVICLLGAFMAGCGSKLSDKFDEEEVRQAAENMVKQASFGELETVYQETFAPLMRQSISFEQLQENLDYVFGKLGEFESIEKVSVAGAQDKDTEEPFAVAVVLAKYQEGKAQYTITFDSAMKCIGFFVK